MSCCVVITCERERMLGFLLRTELPGGVPDSSCAFWFLEMGHHSCPPVLRADPVSHRPLPFAAFTPAASLPLPPKFSLHLMCCIIRHSLLLFGAVFNACSSKHFQFTGYYCCTLVVLHNSNKFAKIFNKNMSATYALPKGTVLPDTHKP